MTKIWQTSRPSATPSTMSLAALADRLAVSLSSTTRWRLPARSRVRRPRAARAGAATPVVVRRARGRRVQRAPRVPGRRVLGLVVTDHLYRTEPDLSRGRARPTPSRAGQRPDARRRWPVDVDLGAVRATGAGRGAGWRGRARPRSWPTPWRRCSEPSTSTPVWWWPNGSSSSCSPPTCEVSGGAQGTDHKSTLQEEWRADFDAVPTYPSRRRPGPRQGGSTPSSRSGDRGRGTRRRSVEEASRAGGSRGRARAVAREADVVDPPDGRRRPDRERSPRWLSCPSWRSCGANLDKELNGRR